MTIQECYAQMNADYASVSERLPSDALIAKLAKKFLDDPSYPELSAAMSQRDAQAAFRASHTLKGVCLNLGFSNLAQPVVELTEILRAGTLEGTAELFAQVTREYERTVAAIRALD